MGLFDRFKEKFNIKDNNLDNDLIIYDKGLEKTRSDFTSKLNKLTSKYKQINSDYFEELEEILIGADIGVGTVISFIERLEKRVQKEKIVSPHDLNEIIVDEMFIIYVNEEIIVNKINFNKTGPTVILFIGVNGVGKTTTIGKMAHKLINENKKVLLVAGDTFRAGAVEQLIEWGKMVEARVVFKNNEDPSSVIYEIGRASCRERV